MSKTRYIKTDFWSDSFIETLDPVEKLLFIYLFTNDRLDLCGIYEISLRKVSFETGINEERVQKIISKFSEKWKIHYIEWYVCVMNFTKHLQINPSVSLWIERSKSLIPNTIIEAIDRLCTGCVQDDALILIPKPILIPKLLPTESCFEIFWKEYPNKVGKPNALKKYKDKEHLDIMSWLSDWKEYWEEAETEQRFIPHPATWLNQERWKDEPPEHEQKQKSITLINNI